MHVLLFLCELVVLYARSGPTLMSSAEAWHLFLLVRFLTIGADAPSPKDPGNGALHMFHKFRIRIINTQTQVYEYKHLNETSYVCVCVRVCVMHGGGGREGGRERAKECERGGQCAAGWEKMRRRPLFKDTRLWNYSFWIHKHRSCRTYTREAILVLVLFTK